MKERIGRREFLRKAGVAALAVPAILHRTSEHSHATNGSSTAIPREGKAKTKRIAVEEHWIVPTGKPLQLPRTSSVNFAEIPQVLPLLANFELRLPLMDESGISMQVISAIMPPATDKDTAIAVARRVNDAQAEIIRKYPGRFAAYAMLPADYPKEGANELERAVTQLGLKRTLIIIKTDGAYLDEQKFWPIWERAEGLGVPVYLHPADPPAATTTLYEGHPELMGPGWSWTVYAATIVLRIIGAGVLDAFPKTTLIVGHLGESLPYLLARLDEGYVMAFKNRKLKRLFSEYIKENMVVTTSGKYRPEALVCAINAMGADRVLFATDYPYVTPKESVQMVESSPISDADKEKIYHLNAERWLKL